MQTTPSESAKAHPFELAGMGIGPFRFLGVASIPSPSLAEHNPDAYNGALRDLPRDLINGCGSCANCGMPITHICIVANSTGQRYGIGSDCVQKTGDRCLGNAAKVAIARIVRNQKIQRANAKREAKRQQFLSTVCNDRGETNAQRIEREQAEFEAVRKAKRQALADKWRFIAPYLSGPPGGFCDSIKESFRAGYEPSGRAVEILGEIYAKSFGRRGSKAYEAALEEFYAKVGEEAN
jgi:hypothetical protein